MEAPVHANLFMEVLARKPCVGIPKFEIWPIAVIFLHGIHMTELFWVGDLMIALSCRFQYPSLHPILWRSILILFFLRLGPRTSKWSFSFRFSKQNSVLISSLTCACCMSCLYYPSWFDHLNNTVELSPDYQTETGPKDSRIIWKTNKKDKGKCQLSLRYCEITKKMQCGVRWKKLTNKNNI